MGVIAWTPDGPVQVGPEAGGVVGIPGPPGPPGQSLNRWYGEGPPTVVVGASPGDEYVNTLSGDLYVLR